MDEQNKKIMFWVIGAIAVTALLAWMIFGNRGEEGTTDHHGPGRISGELTFDALTPEEGDEGTITFEIRKYNTGDVFAPATMSITPSFSNGGTWMIENLEEGVSYDVQANIIINGEEITKSQIATVTAPASDVNIVLTVTWTDLPEQSVKSSQNKNISGELAISGHIPDGATYAIFTAPARDNSDLGAQDVDNPQFTRVVNGTKVTADNLWTWSGALAQVNYQIRAELYTESGDYIGTSHIETAAVPQHNVVLIVQSKAITEPVETPISGTVTLHGSYKSDSIVVVEVRENGVGGFVEVDSFPAESNRTWVYTHAKSGMNYDVRALLERKGEEQAKSSQKHTVAPTNNITLKIDTDLNLTDPTERPVVVKCEKKEDHKYDVTLNFPGINNAKIYWLRIGKEKHHGDRFNEPEKPNNDGEDVDVKMRIDKEKYYYAEYAYSYCKDCTTLDSYSDFSSSLKFYCGDEPEDD